MPRRAACATASASSRASTSPAAASCPASAGGEAPRGCTPAELAAGFSARLMWRAAGEGELYLYAPDRAARCGDSIGRGAFRLPAGTWAELAQEVVLNTPGRADGRIRLWLDGRPVLDRGGLLLRETAAVRVDGLLFASFFGGSDPSWASPRDQSAEFSGFELWEAAAR
ncbi:polysaccharide lyase [Dankookia sp. P2]|uniref:polysaccharide lyase n=1 Tax=Dankookia sp. P2 TaxID=3423955 RepID=UPI003D6718E7